MQTVDRRRFNTGLFLGFGLAGCAQLPAGAPDLIVTGFRWSEDDGATWHTGPIQAGSNVWFEADVKNQGTGPTPAGVIIGVAYRANGIMVAWSDHHTTALQSGQTVSLRANGGPDGDKYWNNAQIGSYTIRAHVDDINRIPNELDETNNILEVSAEVQQPGQSVGDTAWAGINARTGAFTVAGYVAAANGEINGLNLVAVRMGMDNVGASGRVANGEGFNWSARDATVDSHLAAGITIRAVVDPAFHVEGPGQGATDQQYRDNYRWYVRNVFGRYKDKIKYYILGNEPDLNQTPQTLTEMLDFARIAKEERDAIDPSIMLESAPVSSPERARLRDAINAGLTQYVDFVGVHNYGGQINEGRPSRPFQWMKTANAASGYPIKPVTSSESGTNATYPHPSSWDGYTYKAKWHALNRVQLKRYGYSCVLYYSINSSAGNDWDVADISSTSPFGVTRFQPVFDTLSAASVDQGLRNPGFESANNGDVDWVTYFAQDQTTSLPVEYGRVSFRTDGANARTGAGYLRLTCGATNYVRQVIEKLTPGRQYTLSAWAKLSASGPTATLRALGFNHLDGEQESAANRTTGAGSYGQLQVTFTPTKTWVVASLETTGGSSSQFVYWDDVSIADAVLALKP